MPTNDDKKPAAAADTASQKSASEAPTPIPPVRTVQPPLANTGTPTIVITSPDAFTIMMLSGKHVTINRGRNVIAAALADHPALKMHKCVVESR